MRDLIRPALFMFARLGLFLSVAVWICTRWWDMAIPHFGHQHNVCAVSSGVLLSSEWLMSAAARRRVAALRTGGGFGGDVGFDRPSSLDKRLRDFPHLIIDDEAREAYARGNTQIIIHPSGHVEVVNDDIDIDFISIVTSGPPPDPRNDDELGWIQMEPSGTFTGIGQADADWALWSRFGVTRGDYELHFSHWLVVSILVLLNVTLHWIYRKRTKAQVPAG